MLYEFTDIDEINIELHDALIQKKMSGPLTIKSGQTMQSFQLDDPNDNLISVLEIIIDNRLVVICSYMWKTIFIYHRTEWMCENLNYTYIGYTKSHIYLKRQDDDLLVEWAPTSICLTGYVKVGNITISYPELTIEVPFFPFVLKFEGFQHFLFQPNNYLSILTADQVWVTYSTADLSMHPTLIGTHFRHQNSLYFVDDRQIDIPCNNISELIAHWSDQHFIVYDPKKRRRRVFTQLNYENISYLHVRYKKKLVFLLWCWKNGVINGLRVNRYIPKCVAIWKIFMS